MTLSNDGLHRGLANINGYLPRLTMEELSGYFQLLEEPLKERLFTRYSADYAAFGYSKPEYLK